MPGPNYPSSLDNVTTLPNPGENAFTDAPDHAVLHTNENEAIIALETKLGTGSSTPVSNQVFIGTGSGVSAWGAVALASMVSGVLPVANGGTGVTSSTGTGSVVLNAGPTISAANLTSSPTIASFSNANHNHTNSAGGGTLNGATAIQAGSIGFAELSTSIFSGQVASYTNTGSGGGTVRWINLGGIKIAYLQGAVASAGAWLIVDLTPIGFTTAPTVTGNCTEQTGSPPGWVEFASKSSPANGAPELGGFSFLTRNSVSSNSAGTICAFMIGV